MVKLNAAIPPKTLTPKQIPGVTERLYCKFEYCTSNPCPGVALLGMLIRVVWVSYCEFQSKASHSDD